MPRNTVMEKPTAGISRILKAPELGGLSEEQLEGMHDAAATVLQAEAELAGAGTSVVAEMLRGQGDFLVWERYPKGDVFDHANSSHYFYHAHDPAEMADGENGHFHLFVRPLTIAPDLVPVRMGGTDPLPEPDDRFVHVGGISVDAFGRPIRLFTTNAWVTNETCYRAEDVIPLLDHFAIRVPRPNPAVNAWVSAMVRLYRPQLEGLLRLRDAVLSDWASSHPAEDVLQDRRLQITSEIPVDITGQIAAIETALDI